MPDAALKGWIDETGRAGGVAVIRGFYDNRLSATLARIETVMPAGRQDRFGVAIDPTAFRRFDISAVPAVIVTDAPLPPCQQSGCVGAPLPEHDRISGNITLEGALERLARKGDVAPHVAKGHLERLRGQP